MNRIICLCILAIGIAAARADLVLEQKIDGLPQMTGTMTMSVKGDNVRMDMPSGPMGSMSVVMDTGTGDMTTLLHSQKMAMRVPGAQMKSMLEAAKKQMALEAARSKPQDTGKSENVGSYTTEIYTMTSTNGVTSKLWVARDFPDYAKIKAQLDKLKDSPFAAMTKDISAGYDSLPGMVVKTEANVNGQNITVTLISAKAETVDASIFDLPKDYKLMTQPAAAPETPQQ